MQAPREGKLGQGAVVGLGNGRHPGVGRSDGATGLDREQRVVGPTVARAKDPLRGDLSGKQSLSKGRVGQGAHPLRMAPRQDGVLDAAIQQGVPRLVAGQLDAAPGQGGLSR